MVVTFTGKPEEFSQEQSAKLAARFDKAGKLIDGKDEKKAHVILSKQRHLHKAEITIQLLGHPVVSVASGSDCYEALCAAVDKLEAQALKLKKKLIDGRKNRVRAAVVAAESPAAPVKGKKAPALRKPRLFRVRAAEASKPMMAEEAMLEFTKRDRVMVFRDPASGRPGVLIRRGDGNFDVVET